MVDVIPMPKSKKTFYAGTKEASVKKMLEKARTAVKNDPSKENKNRLKLLEEQYLLDAPKEKKKSGGGGTYTPPKDLKLPGAKRTK